MSSGSYLFELSGEHPSLPAAEVLACLDAECAVRPKDQTGPGFVIAPLRREELDAVVPRLALTFRVGRYLGDCASEDAERFVSSLDLPEGSASLRVRRFQGAGTPELADAIAKRAGGALAAGHKVNLTRPDIEVRALLSDRLRFHLSERTIDRDQYERRHVRSRPYFSPVSLHPRYARALVNLTRVRKGQTLLDPFCGTGGILMEAALLGARTLGSDIAPEMVKGCEKNLAHFGLKAERLEVGDVGSIGEIFGRVDVIASDPPYGRSATTKKENVGLLHGRALTAVEEALAPGSRAGLVFPSPCVGTERLSLEDSHTQRVHRSLTRHYCLFTRR
jgi:tRNA (guanine10-N2)-dimethyltransferase